MIALLALLAARHTSGGSKDAPTSASPNTGATPEPDASPGEVIGGLGGLLKQFQQNGQGDVASSWVGTGPNKAIAPKDLASALGADRINALMAYSGMSREDMLNGLSQHLPNVVDKLTPDGRPPTEEEAARLV